MADSQTTHESYGWTHDETARRQRRRALGMSPAERLRWLEERLEELLPLLGTASKRQEPSR